MIGEISVGTDRLWMVVWASRIIATTASQGLVDKVLMTLGIVASGTNPNGNVVRVVGASVGHRSVVPCVGTGRVSIVHSGALFARALCIVILATPFHL